jgi:NAD(P)-dependent dehydrogenase (short-subunit alcohol dehydrogenase family)
MESCDVAGRRVVVTGASRGLGRAIAGAFVQAGARVALVARGVEASERLAAELDGETLVCQADVAVPEDNERVAGEVMDAWGGLDVWIANAGVSPVVAGPLETTVEDWRHVMAVNLDGVFFGARAAAGAMAGSGGGRIIVTTSVLAERPRKGLGAYSAAKAGVTGLVKALALDLAGERITVNAVAPGWFDSPMAEGWKQNPKLEEKILGHTALRRWGHTSDLPGAYVFLASDAASFVTGTVLTVDGGYLCV